MTLSNDRAMHLTKLWRDSQKDIVEGAVIRIGKHCGDKNVRFAAVQVKVVYPNTSDKVHTLSLVRGLISERGYEIGSDNRVQFTSQHQKIEHRIIVDPIDIPEKKVHTGQFYSDEEMVQRFEQCLREMNRPDWILGWNVPNPKKPIVQLTIAKTAQGTLDVAAWLFPSRARRREYDAKSGITTRPSHQIRVIISRDIKDSDSFANAKNQLMNLRLMKINR